MAYGPIALTIPQYEDFPNYWLKAYDQGTTTPLAMATDVTGGTTAAKFQLDSTGFPVTAGNARLIPFIQGDYDLWLFPTAAEADANDTTNAIQFADNLNADPLSSAPTVLGNDKRYGPVFATVAAMVATSPVSIDGIVVDLQPGMTVTTQEYATGNNGGATYVIASSGSPDEFTDHTLDNGNIAVLQAGDTLNVLQHGLSPNLADNQTAITAFIAYWMPTERRAYVPAGDYLHSGRMLFDVTLNPNRRMPEMFGDSPYSSKFISSSTTAPVYHIFGSAAGPDHFQGKLSRLGFQTDLPNIGFAIGLSNYTDNHGNYTIDQCFFANSNSTSNAAAESLQLNWLFDCDFRNCVVVGKANFGKALNMRKVQFTTFAGGSYSNAFYGVAFDGGVGGTCFANTFTSPDIENCTIGIYGNQVDSHRNRFIQPYIDIRDPVGDAEPSGGYVFNIQTANVGGYTVEDFLPARSYSEVYTGTALIEPTSNFNLLNITGRYSGQTTPAVPASDAAETNKTGQVQRVTIWGGTVTEIFINGVSRTLTGGQFDLLPGEFIAVRYSVLPTWNWSALVI